ncbi:MAG: alpha/beta fold hydrolase, partial [Acidimicrobiales bacterium]
YPDRTLALVYLDGTGIGQAWHQPYREERRRRLGNGFDRWMNLSIRRRIPDEEAEMRRLAWGVDFADSTRGTELAAAMDRPFRININDKANRLIGDEMGHWDEDALASRCAALVVPTLVVHGAEDPRPAWAVDSMVAALPDATALVLADAGHVPWLEAGDRFFEPLRDFLRRVTVPGWVVR